MAAIKKNYYRFVKVGAAVVVALIFATNFLTAFAQTSVTAPPPASACFTITLSLINVATNTQSTTNTIKASQASKYGLQVHIKTNFGQGLGTYSLRGERYADEGGSHGTPVETVNFADGRAISSNDITENSGAFGRPQPYTYSYILDVNNNICSLSTHLNVYFTNDQGGTGGGSTGNSNGNANGGANGNTNHTGPPNNAINTGTGANFNINLDQSLGTFFNPLNANSIPELIAIIVRILFVLIGITAVIVIIIAGFRMVVDSGNETQMKKAKEAITWAVIGLIVSILAFSIVAIIQRVIQS